jgi:hypothetical protein
MTSSLSSSGCVTTGELENAVGRRCGLLIGSLVLFYHVLDEIGDSGHSGVHEGVTERGWRGNASLLSKVVQIPGCTVPSVFVLHDDDSEMCPLELKSFHHISGEICNSHNSGVHEGGTHAITPPFCPNLS